MEEEQVFMRLEGKLAAPTCLVSARAGVVRFELSRGGSQQHAQSREVPADLLADARCMHDDALTKLERFQGLDAVLKMHGLLRHRQVAGVPSYTQSFTGFWGTLKIKDQPTSIFGSDLQDGISFRRGPWEGWSLELPQFDVVDSSQPLVLSPYCATLFHEAVGHALEADFLQGSPLKFYTGEKISHSRLSVVDRPDLTGYAASMSHDDTGIKVSETTLIHQGFLVGDLSKGAFRRASFREPPLVRATNFLISNGTEDPQSWLSQLANGYYVTWIQSGSWRPGSTQFKVLTGPIFQLRLGVPVAFREWASLQLTIGTFLNGIAAVGNDLTMDPVVHWCMKQNQRVPMSMGSPSLLLENWQ